MTARLPLIDVAITSYGIGPVLADTVLSVLHQTADSFDLRCLVVVDGCSVMATTRAILDDLQASGAYDLRVIYQKNAGVTQARNRAIDAICAAAEAPDYVLLMDGDDVMPTNYLASGIAAIENADPDRPVGWAYTDQFHFGNKVAWAQYPRRVWGARFALNNLSQPSSVMKFALLRDGLRFDPTFNLGIEDWEFWCQAVGAGYEGVYVDDTYMRYRRLLGSRSSFNRSNDSLTKFRLRKKHGLESYATLMRDFGAQTRMGRFVSKPAATAQGCVDVTLDDASLARFWSAVTMFRRTRKHVYMDDPAFPEIFALGDAAVDAGDMYFARQMFGTQKSLFALTTDTCTYVAPRRLFDEYTRRIAQPQMLRATWDGTSLAGAAVAPLVDLPDPALQILIDSAPHDLPRYDAGFDRELVGQHAGSHWDFMTQALDYMPFYPLPATDTPRRAVVWDARQSAPLTGPLPAFDGSTTLIVLADRDAGHATIPDTLIRHAHADGTLWLHDLRGPPKVDNHKHYNGFAYGQFDDSHSRYICGALSWFDTIVNLGSAEVTTALSRLKSSKRTDNIYIPAAANADITEIEHLCVYLGTYRTIIHAPDTWAVVASAMGVPQKLFADITDTGADHGHP